MFTLINIFKRYNQPFQVEKQNVKYTYKDVKKITLLLTRLKKDNID